MSGKGHFHLWPFLFNQPITVKISGWFNKEGQNDKYENVYENVSVRRILCHSGLKILRRLPTSLQ